jgi:hypothetical protein
MMDHMVFCHRLKTFLTNKLQGDRVASFEHFTQTQYKIVAINLNAIIGAKVVCDNELLYATILAAQRLAESRLQFVKANHS